MKKNYWVYQLKATTLWTLLFHKSQVSHLTYVLSTRWARVWLFCLLRVHLFTFPIQVIPHRTSPAGPVMQLHALRDDRGRVFTLDINRHVLELRREIVEQVLPRWKKLSFLNYYSSLTMLKAYLGLRIAAEINGLVFFAHYARWKFFDPALQEQTPNIFIIPPCQWSSILVANLEKMLTRVVVQKHGFPPQQATIGLVKHLLHAVGGTLFSPSAPPASSPVPPPSPSKIMISYAMGTIADRRNDISFFYAVKGAMPVSRLLFYFRYPDLQPSAVEMEWFRHHHIPCFTAPIAAANMPAIPRWSSSPGFKPILVEFFRVFLKTTAQCLWRPRMHSLWLLDRLWDMGWNVAVWKDFFITNQVRVVVHSVPGDWNYIPTMAIHEAGGIAVNLERSMLFDYCTFFHNSPSHVSFVTGTYSLGQIPEPSLSRHTVVVGGLNIGNLPDIPWIAQQQQKQRRVITVFDELPNDWYFGDAIRQLYEALLELMATDESHRLALLIKTKKPEVLERLEAINQQVQVLIATGRCLVPDWKVTPAAAAAHSDLVVCVPSTAAFESVMTGTPTIVFSPMKAGSSLFYTQHGLNRRIFEDSENMKAAIRRFADGTDITVGDCTDLQKQIDPYGDGRGAERVGLYLNQCLESFDRGQPRDSILQKENQHFANQWGEDKMIHESFYEN